MAIYSGDIVVAARSIKPVNSHPVVVQIEGKNSLRRLERKNSDFYFCSGSVENDVRESGSPGPKIWGAITYTFHKRL